MGNLIRAQLIIYSRANNFSWSSLFLFQKTFISSWKEEQYICACIGSIWYCSEVSPHHLPVRPEANLIRYYFLHIYSEKFIWHDQSSRLHLHFGVWIIKMQFNEKMLLYWYLILHFYQLYYHKICQDMGVYYFTRN